MPKKVRNLVRRPGRPGWYFRRQEHGRTVWRSLGTDYELACSHLRSLKTEVETLPDCTVGEAAKKWLESYVAVHRREADRPLAAQRVRDYLVPNLGHYLLRRVSPEHLRRYRLKLEQSHLKPQSVAHVLSDCRCFLRWCEETGLVDRAPIPRKFLPRIQERPPERLSDEEIRAVVSLPDPHGFLCRFLLSTGLRWGELMRAQTSDVQAGVLVVHQTKSGKVRRVPLPPDIQAELKGRVGKLTNLKHACSLAQTVRNRTGIKSFHVHALRHSFACKWIEDGGSLAALQVILGHSTVVTTQRYAKLSDDLVQREAERLGSRVYEEKSDKTSRTM